MIWLSWVIGRKMYTEIMLATHSAVHHELQ